MTEHGRAVTHQMFCEQDGVSGLYADQFFEPPLALDQRQVAQIVAVKFEQVEGVQHRLVTPASVAQRKGPRTISR